MRILLDESLPQPLIRVLPEHEVRTVAAMGWSGIRNGPLLELAAGEFDAFLTADQNLEHQQNLGTLPIAVVVLVATPIGLNLSSHWYPPCFEFSEV